MPEERMVRPVPISGFPEWLPEIRMIELGWLDRIRQTFERYGFASIETPSVESLDVLTAKGETSQEVYTLHRLQADDRDDTADTDARLGLHFDLTVPAARYVAQHFNELDFPFKRYQIQRVWRGERPQEGRFREFTQCDIDVINVDHVPLHFDAEMPRLVHEVLTALDVGEFSVRINNRKVLQGFYEGLGIADPVAAIQVMDKLDKVGTDGVSAMLADDLGLADEQVRACLELAQITSVDTSFAEAVRKLGVTAPLLDEGLDELAFVMDELADLPVGAIVADLAIARGLDYYTGTVYETFMDGYERLGSVCSGGRYDNLASDGKNRFPGVGISIGVSRILVPLIADGRLDASREVPTCVLVALPDGDSRRGCDKIAASLRSRGIATQVAPAAQKYGKQIKFAERRGIPFVVFPATLGDGHEIRDIRSGDQSVIDVDSWSPPASDLRPTIVRGDG